MKDPIQLLYRYYPEGETITAILTEHGLAVAEKCRSIALKMKHPAVDPDFVFEAAMLHDIGIRFTHAPEIGCFGELPYLCHGYLGHDLLLAEGLPRHALVCERHTGTGLTMRDILDKNLPIPLRPMTPVSLEEKLIAYCDKFFSKTGDLRIDGDVAQIAASLGRYGEKKRLEFLAWHDYFSAFDTR